MASSSYTLISDAVLVPDVVLDITIKAGDPPSVYNFVGKICWEKIIGNHCQMGIQLEEAEGTDLITWVIDYGI